jgi:3-deoxy-D-manno-octulosonic-acid transferase
VWAYSFAIAIASIWNTKARLIRRGRKHTWKRLASLDAAKQTVWFHCASLGEFEMARPVMEGFLDQNPSFQLVVSFFSPSGFEFRKNYERAAAVVYLPADVAKNTQKFVDLVKPAFAVFVKYDLWYHYLRILKERQIPYYLISAVFRPGHRYFKNKLFYSMLSDAQQIFVQDDVSLELLQQKIVPRLFQRPQVRPFVANHVLDAFQSYMPQLFDRNIIKTSSRQKRHTDRIWG